MVSSRRTDASAVGRARRRPRTDGPPAAAPAFRRQRSELERFAELAGAMGAVRLRVVAVRLVERAGAQAVALFFRHEEFPDVLFAYRAMPPGADPHERVWLAEELATGGLVRIMRAARPVADVDGVVWLELRGSRLVAERGV